MKRTTELINIWTLVLNIQYDGVFTPDSKYITYFSCLYIVYLMK
jgi:hypothetical protein